ncbi:MAG: MarR family transcriptional regulator [Clostridia bacterium]|nr:MarR family transcriptional regulator [Clostridia bacterium]
MRERDSGEGVMSQPGAHLVLSVLAIHDGIHQLELVQQTHLRPPTVSVILKKMEAEGLVERRSDPDDLRAMRVYLTDAGRVLDKENIERIRKLDALAMQDLSQEEIDVLMRLLPKIRNTLLTLGAEEEKEKGKA